MKKKTLIQALFCFLILFVGCRKSALLGTENCLENVEKINATLQTYISDPSVNNCKNYVNALRSYVESGSCFGNIFFEEYKRSLKELEAEECN
jgi:hypothetical protein